MGVAQVTTGDHHSCLADWPYRPGPLLGTTNSTTAQLGVSATTDDTTRRPSRWSGTSTRARQPLAERASQRRGRSAGDHLHLRPAHDAARSGAGVPTTHGQLGDGTNRPVEPLPVRGAATSAGTGPLLNVRRQIVRRGANGACALCSPTTEVRCWGDDDYGQLGNGAPLSDANLPVIGEGPRRHRSR